MFDGGRQNNSYKYTCFTFKYGLGNFYGNAAYVAAYPYAAAYSAPYVAAAPYTAAYTAPVLL